MSHPATEDETPPLSPMQRRGQIEVDTFCVGCHYNLHGQAVTVDDRLNIPVCRCPECGRFHPAGTGVTASGVWVRRLATVLLFNWVAIVLAMALTICFFLGALSLGTVEAYTRGILVSADGQPVTQAHTAGGFGGYVIKGTSTPAPSTRWVSLLHPILGGPAGAGAYAADVRSVGPSDEGAWYVNGPGPTPWLCLSAGSVGLGAVAGGLCATFLWHWPRRRYAWCLLVVVVPAVFLIGVYLANDQYMLIRGQATGRALAAVMVQGIGVVVGTRVGRPIARAVVRVVIPPKPRQALAFLWQVDGKQLPV